MSGIRRDDRRQRLGGRPTPTRAERKAEARRVRALSHLQRLRGQLPSRAPRRAIFAAMAALSLAAGAASGIALASGAAWLDRDPEVALISIRGAGHLSAAEVAVATGVSRSVALSAALPASIEERLEEHDWIAAASALRLPTGTLLVDVTERIPVAVVSVGSPARTYVVDASGMPFAPAERRHGEALPHVVTAGAVAELEPNEEVARAARLAHDLPRFGLTQPVLVSIAGEGDPTGFALRIEGRRARIILGPGGPAKRAASGGGGTSDGGARTRDAVHIADRPGDPAVQLAGG
jgi:hypothetical protein